MARSLFQKADGHVPRRLSTAAKHPDQFVNPLISGYRIEMGPRPTTDNILLHHIVPRRRRRHLREVSDRHHLMPRTKRRHFLPNCTRDLATDIRVDFIEDHQRRRILIRQRTLHRQHHPRNLTARSNQAQRLKRLTRIRTKQKLNPFKSMNRWLPLRLQSNLER